jgi:hypothetical protein
LPVCCCIDDLDCDDTDYCLYTTGGPSHSGTCVAFEQLGGTCEENHDLHFFHQCAPSLACIHILPGMSGKCEKPYGG